MLQQNDFEALQVKYRLHAKLELINNNKILF